MPTSDTPLAERVKKFDPLFGLPEVLLPVPEDGRAEALDSREDWFPRDGGVSRSGPRGSNGSSEVGAFTPARPHGCRAPKAGSPSAR